MGMSAAAKNMFGVVPGTFKPEYHFRYPNHRDFAKMMLDLNAYFAPKVKLCLADAIVGASRPAPLTGLAVFSKRVVLCGEDSRTHIYTSNTRIGRADGLTAYAANRPTGVVEVLDPMVLSSKVKEICDCACNDNALVQIPGCVREMFDEEMVVSGERRRLFVTLGQFSVIRLERDAQLVVPVVDCAVPSRECCDAAGSAEDPCEMFSRIPFPTSQFCPTGCTDPCTPPSDNCGYKTLGD
jgi:hypothetical protein